MDRFWVMLCPSPISHKTILCMAIVLLDFAGMCRPHCAIIESNPTVLRATVLPPVFGPVMTIPVILSSI